MVSVVSVDRQTDNGGIKSLQMIISNLVKMAEGSPNS